MGLRQLKELIFGSRIRVPATQEVCIDIKMSRDVFCMNISGTGGTKEPDDL